MHNVNLFVYFHFHDAVINKETFLFRRDLYSNKQLQAYRKTQMLDKLQTHHCYNTRERCGFHSDTVLIVIARNVRTTLHWNQQIMKLKRRYLTWCTRRVSGIFFHVYNRIQKVGKPNI